jgi:hypothetical protein
MPTRRTLLSRVVALAAAGPFVGVGAAASGHSDSDPDPEDADEPTEIAVSGQPEILQLVGAPDVAVPSLGSVRSCESVSPSAVTHVAGTIAVRGANVTSGSGTAWGSFDVPSVTDELQSVAAFRRGGRTDESEANDADPPSQDGGADASGHDQQSQSTRRLVRSDPATVVDVGPARIDAAQGDSRDDAASRVASGRERSRPAVDEQDRAHRGRVRVSLAEPARSWLTAAASDATEEIAPVLQALQTASVAVRATPETTRLRYALSLAEDNQAGDAPADLVADLADHGDTRLLDRSVSETAVTARVSVRTDSVWTVHENVLGV